MTAPTASPLRIEGLIRIAAKAASKEDAIRQAGQMLVAAGCVAPAYVESMLAREGVANTFLGSGVAIPHGMGADKGLVAQDGLVVLQLREGLEWNPGQIAHLVVGIAANSDSHISILRRLTRLLQNEEALAALISTDSAEQIALALTGEGLFDVGRKQPIPLLPAVVGVVTSERGAVPVQRPTIDAERHGDDTSTKSGASSSSLACRAASSLKYQYLRSSGKRGAGMVMIRACGPRVVTECVSPGARIVMSCPSCGPMAIFCST